jgi:hypothetical protein
LFVSPGAGDYHLRPNSPAINVGTAMQAPALDYEGHPRPANGSFDIGADEARNADFNADGLVNHLDIDQLAWAAHNEPENLAYDLNGDGAVTFAIGPGNSLTTSDSNVLIRDILKTEYGDLDLNGEVFLSDLTTLATRYRQAGQFGWADGNINGSQEAGTTASPRVFLSDLTALAANWRFGISTGASVAGAVPEPSGVIPIAWVAFAILSLQRRGWSRIHQIVERCSGVTLSIFAMAASVFWAA